MSLMFSLRVHCMQEIGIDPETGKPPAGKMKKLLKMMKKAKKKHRRKKMRGVSSGS